MKREVILADHSGFCFGVRRAVEMADSTLAELHDKCLGAKCYSHGPIIHNETVIEEFASKGLHVIDEISECDNGGTLLVRAHGEPESFYKDAEESGITLVDTTCPFVEKIHKIASKASLAGETVVIVGTEDHPEVVGIAGWANGRAHVVNSREEAEALRDELKAAGAGDITIVAQTTIKEKLFIEVSDILKEAFPQAKIENTICNATHERQEAARNLAKTVDAMVVIGGKESSNSRKLFEIADEACAHAYFIENLSELDLEDLEKYEKIGISAGASTPENVINEVIKALKK